MFLKSVFNVTNEETQRLKAREREIARRETMLDDREYRGLAEREQMRLRINELRLSEARGEQRIATLEQHASKLEDLVRAAEAERDELLERINSAGPIDLPLNEAISHAISTLEGWCTLRKARMLCDVIKSNDCRTVMEVGIYGGRSLIPMALTMKHLGRGTVIGIDPWSNGEAAKAASDAKDTKWWTSVDLDHIKRCYFAALFKFDVISFVKTLEITSAQAMAALAGHRFDLVHVDGGHSEQQAYGDVNAWSTFLSETGILVLDDINWETVGKARSWVLERFGVIDEVREEGGSFGIYRKRGRA